MQLPVEWEGTLGLIETINTVGREYPAATSEPFDGHPMHARLAELREALKAEAGPLSPTVKVRSGLGKFGTWAEVPWVAMLDDRANAVPQQGVYVVLLFASDGGTLHVSLNQGCDQVRSELGKPRALKVIAAKADLYRAALGLSVTPAPVLGGRSARSELYEAGHIWGRSFSLPAIDGTQIVEAIGAALDAYDRLIGLDLFDPSTDGNGAEDEADLSVTERKRYRRHLKLERRAGVSKKVKQLQGYVCKGCDTSLAQTYGTVGEGCIEAHHLKPLSTLDAGTPTTFDLRNDFAVLCPNCHTIIHRLADPSDLNALRALVLKTAAMAAE